jgi:hypothetical protein
MSLHLPGTCLYPADENRRVAERIAALEKVSKDASSLWAASRHHSAVVLLQDRAQHIGEAVDGCRKSLTTMYSVCFPAILCQEALSSYSMFSDLVSKFIS